METGRPDLDQLVRVASIPANEPVFILRGKDMAAAPTVRAWATMAFELGAEPCVIEQALQQADRIEAFPVKSVPNADHLSADERKQLGYQLNRRAWSEREGASAILPHMDLILAQVRGAEDTRAKLKNEAARAGVQLRWAPDGSCTLSLETDLQGAEQRGYRAAINRASEIVSPALLAALDRLTHLVGVVAGERAAIASGEARPENPDPLAPYLAGQAEADILALGAALTQLRRLATAAPAEGSRK